MFFADDCTAWSALTVETYTNPQTDYENSNDFNHYEDYEDCPKHNYYGQSQFVYYIKDILQQLH